MGFCECVCFSGFFVLFDGGLKGPTVTVVLLAVSVRVFGLIKIKEVGVNRLAGMWRLKKQLLLQFSLQGSG